MKTNIYDFIISELVYRTAVSNLSSGPYLDITSDLPFNDIAPYTFNGNVSFTSVVKNIPTGYTVQASSHIINYPIVWAPAVSSAIENNGTPVPIIFTTPGDSFTVTVTVTLEMATFPDIIVTDTFTVNAFAELYAGALPTNSAITTAGLSSFLYNQVNQKFSLPVVSGQYVYVVFPGLAPVLPLFIRDRNGLVIELSDFTTYTTATETFLVLSWPTNIAANTKWELVYTI